MDDWQGRSRGYILLVLVCLIVVGGVLILVRRPAPKPIVVTTAVIPTHTLLPTPTPTPSPAPLRVYVSGAVRTPDVYLLPPGSIVKDALLAAGGPTDDADLVRINLALGLYDQQQVYVPRTGEATPAVQLPVSAPSATPVASSSDAPRAGDKINLNAATIEQLDTLPGIGPVLAQRIIDYREANGPFAAPKDIMNVKGIGQATYEKLKDLVVAP